MKSIIKRSVSKVFRILFEVATVKVKPEKFFTKDRLDLVVKYFLFQEIHTGLLTQNTAELYEKHLLKRTGLCEPTDLFGQSSKKNGLSAHLDMCQHLYASMKTCGFLKDFAVPVVGRRIGNGAHRLACSLVLGRQPKLKLLLGANAAKAKSIKSWGFEWFRENGFTEGEINKLLGGFSRIHKNRTGVFVLYAPAKEKWAEIQEFISCNFESVGFTDVIVGERAAFRELILDMYQDLKVDGVIHRKADLLSNHETMLRVVVVHNMNQSSRAFNQKMTVMKAQIRQIASEVIDPDLYLTIHAGSSVEENDYLTNLFFNRNNMSCLAQRKSTFSDEMTDWLNELLATLKRHDIPLSSCCVVGSSSMEIFNIRKSTDIDIVVLSEIRKKFKVPGPVPLSENVDIVSTGYPRVEAGVVISDDELVENSDYHFYVRGIKFSNLNVVYDRKKVSRRDKDLKDVTLIDEYDQQSGDNSSLNIMHGKNETFSVLLAEERTLRN
jgi:hypothetical protein